MTPARDPGHREVADVEIGAAASAKRLRFRTKPDTEVRFGGSPEIESDSHTERENLPEEVEPGVTYRDVKVSWVGGARIDDAAISELEDEIEARARKASEES